MLGRIIAVAVAGAVVWALLKWAEEAAGERSGAFFRIAKVVLVVVIFFVEFALVTVIPQTAQDVVQNTYGPTPYESVGGQSGYP